MEPPVDASASTHAQVQYREGLEGVDFTGMAPQEVDRALGIMNEQWCDCGCGMRIAECRVKDPTCPRSPGLAAAVMDGVRSSLSDDVILASLGSVKDDSAAGSRGVSISLEGVLFRGNPDAPVTLVAYSDFQCPYCARAVPIVHELLGRYPDDVRFVFKQFPLTTIHRHALAAAQASLAAGRQGRFWEMHDLLFQSSSALDDDSLREYARRLGLDGSRFERDRNDPSIREQVVRDVQEAQTLGVSGTPAFYMNGVALPSWDLDLLDHLVRSVRAGGDVGVELARLQGDEQTRAALPPPEPRQDATFQFDLNGTPIRGADHAPVTIVEFAGFQCPHSAGSQPLIKRLLDAYQGKVRLAFKHLPMKEHPSSLSASLVSLEAMREGGFWEMHDLLFKNYGRLTEDSLIALGETQGLDPARLRSAMGAGVNSTIIRDAREAKEAGVVATPTFFVNGRRVERRDFQTFSRMIDEALADLNPSPP